MHNRTATKVFKYKNKVLVHRGFVGKRHVDGNQTILVWHALVSKLRNIRDKGPELEALVTFSAPHKSAMNQGFYSASRMNWYRLFNQ